MLLSLNYLTILFNTVGLQLSHFYEKFTGVVIILIRSSRWEF